MTLRWAVFRSLLVRDLTVLDKRIYQFLPGTLMQPLLMVFVFSYLFPAIGQGIGGEGGAARFSTLLVPGIVAQSITFFGVFSMGLTLVRELDTEELEDRVLAPAPISILAAEKVASGAVQSLFAAMIVFPVAAFVPATPVYLAPRWPVLATITALACLMSGALGLALGTLFEPRSVSFLFSFVALPLSFFGATFYTWNSLRPVPVVRYAVLANPLVYASEGLRAALVTGVPHMPLPAVYGAMAGATVAFTAVGVRNLKHRVLS